MKYTALVFCVTCCIGISPVSAGALLDAARVGNNSQVNRILKPGVDVGERGPHGETALHWMAFYGNETMVRRLITAGAGINDRLEKGSTPLHLAVYNGHTGVARLLIKHGAKVNARTQTGITPLDWARRNDHTEVVRLLIAHDAKAGQGAANKEAIAVHRQTGMEHAGAQTGIAPPDWVAQNGQGEAEEPLIVLDTEAHRAPSGNRATIGHRKIRLEDLKYYPEQDGITTTYRDSQALQPTSALIGDSTGKNDHPDNPPQAASFRIQLAALSSEQRAVDAWALYRREYPDILAGLELVLDPVGLRGKRLYRVQTGRLTRGNAQSMCDQLKRRSQPCMVISPESL